MVDAAGGSVLLEAGSGGEAALRIEMVKAAAWMAANKRIVQAYGSVANFFAEVLRNPALKAFQRYISYPCKSSFFMKKRRYKRDNVHQL